MEENELTYEQSLELIVHAGDAKITANDAIAAAGEYKFDLAESKLSQAKRELAAAHQIQTSLIQAEAAGKGQAVRIIMVHAQDYLCMAMMAIDQARQAIQLNARLQRIEEKLNERSLSQ